MQPRRRPVPDHVFDALARGGGGGEAAAYLNRTQYGKHLLLVREVMETAAAEGHPDAERARRDHEALALAQEAAPEAVARLLRHPTVGVWARRTILALTGHRDEEPRVGAMSALAAAAAFCAGIPTRLPVPLYGPTAPLPGLGRAVLGGAGTGQEALFESGTDGAQLVLGRTTVRVPDDPHEDAPAWNALRRLRAEHRGRRLDLLLDDQDADRMPGAEIEPRRLDDGQVRRWCECLQQAWELLVEHHWTIAEEAPYTVRTMTPMSAPEGVLTSATVKHAFGNLGLSPPLDPVWLALTFAHEIQHAKLTALLDLVKVTMPDGGRFFYAPWRPDPRPMDGLVQGIYAHLGVAGFWRRQRLVSTGQDALYAETEFAHWRRSSADAGRTILESGLLTPVGERFLTATHKTLLAWQEEPVPRAAAEAAETAAREHLARWRAQHEPDGGDHTFETGGRTEG